MSASRPDDSLIFGAVLETAFDNIYVVDRDLRYTHVSRGGAEALGLTPEKMIGIRWIDLGVEPELMKRVERDLRHVIDAGEVVRREVPYETTGGRRYYEYVASPVRSADSIVGAFVISRDVTARVVAEQELRHAEERYRSFIDHSSEGIWRFEFDEPIDTSLPPDEQIRLMFDRAYLAECNDALAQMYGFERAEELIGARLPQMLDPAEECNWDYLRGVIAGGYRLDNAESAEVDRFGRRKYFINSLAAVIEDGRVVRGWGVQRDVTEQKAAMDRLRLSEERLQALVKASAQIVWTTDANGRLDWISDSWTDVTGQSHKEAKGVGWLEMLHAGDRARSEQLWQHAIESRAVYDNMVRIRTRDGTYRWYRIRGAPVFNDEGSVREWVGSSNDIDAERQQELTQSADQLRAEFIAEANDLFVRSLDYEETLRSLVRLAVPRLADWCAVDMVEPDGSLRRLAVRHVDPAKIRLAFELQERYPPDMNAPRPPPHVVRTGQTEFIPTIPDELIEAVAQDKEHLELIQQLRLRSYICTPIRVREEVAGVLTLVIAESERAFTARDVELAEALALRAGHAVENARLYQQAVEANRAKDEFLATLSHELRTPLTAILGWANLLRLANYDRDTVRGAIDTIERSAKTQAAIIDDLLDVSRIITGKYQISPEAIDIVPIVRNVADSTRPAAEGKRLQIDVNAPQSLVIRADPNRLQQIVWNLTSNAVKFTEEGGRIEVAVERQGDDAVIRVTDQGVGIAPEVLPRVFDRFWQADSSTNRTYGGLGLGLAIVKHLTEMHGGTASAKSEGAGKGATFVVTLPVGDVDSDQAATTAGPRSTSQRVLLVDDDGSARDVVTKMLEHFGARVTSVATAGDAADLVRNEKFDVVLTDVAMPEHDGYWLLERIRAAQPDVHVAAITALGVSDSQISAAGFDSFVRKPVDPAKLGELLDRTAAV